MAIDEREIERIKIEVIEKIEPRLIARGDERYVMVQDCNDRQEAINKKLANDDKRIEIISHDFATIKKLMWAIASATVGSLVASLFELIIK